jgi:hypothetical protein
MIQDPESLTLLVEADDGVATAEVSVSLGLIVPELVINALKHAVPCGRGGGTGDRRLGRRPSDAHSNDGVDPAGPESSPSGAQDTAVTHDHLGESGQRTGAGSVHYRLSVTFNCPLADPKVCRDVFVRLPVKHADGDLMLACGQGGEVITSSFPPG